MQSCWKLASVATHIAIGDPVGGEEFASGPSHLLVDALKSTKETADVVVPVPVRPDVVNHFRDGPGRLVRRLGRDRRGRPEIREERAVEAVEDREVRFIGELLALAGTTPEHLLEQNA